jgi:RNA polymerase sigma factor (sigma-70 family)
MAEAAGPLARDVRQALEVAHARGRLAHGALGLSAEEYASHALASAARRLARRPDGEAPALARVVGDAVAADLYLAAAASRDVEGAWARLDAELRPRLEALARSRGASPNDADRLVSELVGDLALPGGGADRLLATYDGTGSLFGWLATILLRRLLRETRASRRRPGSLDDETASPPAPRLGPAEGAEAREVEERVGVALDRALERLTPRERAALVLRHADGRTGREIARLLGVGAPRVSRLLDQATSKVRDAVVPELRAAGWRGRWDDTSWASLRDRIGLSLGRVAIPGPGVPPTPGETVRTEALRD